MKKFFREQKKKMNKKGFTLVELLVCVAIMAIIALLLAQFVASTTGAYRRTSATTSIQENCMQSLTQVSNIVRNSKSLKVTKYDNGITFESLNHENKKIVLVYIASENEPFGAIYVDYNHGQTVSSISREEEVIPELDLSLVVGKEEFLLTDMIKEFTVDFSSYEKTTSNEDGVVSSEPVVQKRTLDLSLTLEKNEKEFTQKYKASLRNSAPDGKLDELVIEMKQNSGVSLPVPTNDSDAD